MMCMLWGPDRKEACWLGGPSDVVVLVFFVCGCCFVLLGVLCRGRGCNSRYFSIPFPSSRWHILVFFPNQSGCMVVPILHLCGMQLLLRDLSFGEQNHTIKQLWYALQELTKNMWRKAGLCSFWSFDWMLDKEDEERSLNVNLKTS